MEGYGEEGGDYPITGVAELSLEDTNPALKVTLEVAVPLWIERLKTIPLDHLLGRADELSQIIAEKGDIIQFRSKKKGETAKAFNALAEALAIGSFMPGGIKFMGMHWEDKHPG